MIYPLSKKYLPLLQQLDFMSARALSIADATKILEVGTKLAGGCYLNGSKLHQVFYWSFADALFLS